MRLRVCITTGSLLMSDGPGESIWGLTELSELPWLSPSCLSWSLQGSQNQGREEGCRFEEPEWQQDRCYSPSTMSAQAATQGTGAGPKKKKKVAPCPGVSCSEKARLGAPLSSSSGPPGGSPHPSQHSRAPVWVSLFLGQGQDLGD